MSEFHGSTVTRGSV